MTPAEECPVGLDSLASEPGAWKCPECLEIRREGEHYADPRCRNGVAKRCCYCRDRKAYWASKDYQRSAAAVRSGLKHWTKKAILAGENPVEIVSAYYLEGMLKRRRPEEGGQ